ncbi:MAG: T9SS type A sorting domain-containing protein, partial [Bacteroidales bacterium]
LIMKRTLLLVAALILGATSANAQRFVSADGKTPVKATATKANFENAKVNKINNKSNAKTAALTVDFDIPTEYTAKALAGHTAGAKGTFARFDTVTTNAAWFATNYPIVNNWFGMANNGFYYFTTAVGAGIGNGFMLVSPYDQFSADGQQNSSVTNTAVELTSPVATTGWNVVDVEFNQYTQRFNYDKYFIDWSTSPTFATYDSIEFNVKGVELNSNEAARNRKRVTLPKASTIDQTALYIRLRYAEYNSTTTAPSGYMWILDSVTVDNGPEARLDVVASNHVYNAYHVVPKDYPLDTMLFVATVSNTGGDTLTNVFAQERIHSIDDISVTPYTYTFIKENRNNPNWWNINFISDTAYIQDPLTLAPGKSHVMVAAVSSNLYSGTAGYHMVSTGVNYAHNGVDALQAIDTIFYEVQDVDPLHTDYSSMRWAADYNMLFEGVSASYGKISQNIVTDDCPSKFSAGFEVCTRFIPSIDLSTKDWFFKGIEVVPAVDSCEAGIRIQGSLKKINWANFPGWDLAVQTVAITNPHTLSNSELNNGLFTDATTPYERTRNFNTIFLPLTTPNIMVDTNAWYYACYKLLDDGMFLVGNDSKNRAYTFNPDDIHSVIVNTPGFTNYSWGDMFGSWLSSNSTPMVRTFVSKNLDNINEVSSSVFNVNAYPNPAQNETSIEYTLGTSGNVVITINDITGREVIRMEQGNQTANSSKRVSINTSNLSNGAYFYNVIVNGVKQTNKLIINK